LPLTAIHLEENMQITDLIKQIPGRARPGALLALTLLVATPAPFAAQATQQPPSAPNAPTVSDAYARAVPPGQANSAAFMRIQNPSGEARALIGAASPAASVVELHTHALEDGMMKMRRVEQITIPAHATVELKPGGLHLMLIGLGAPLVPGDPVDLRLSFDDGTSLEVRAETRALDASHLGAPERQDH
jgi:copper(I)-binding protein